MPSITTILLFVVILSLVTSECFAFGAGDIPDFAYLNDRAFRHGDIENVLSQLAKTVGAGGGGILGLASAVLSGGQGKNFSKSDVKHVYFGNWLRDYSQALDIGGLSKLSADTLIMILSVLGFMTFGYATDEYEVTADRIGVYLPVEHIDNPKGYAEKEGDAREFHPKLRPPVDPEELEIDERTGMKNYMATEGRSWDTSTAHIRRVLGACIEYGRRARGREGPDLFEAYRLLGTGLHTLEDLLAHSNWCEIALRKMGHQSVFCHVGDRVVVNTPNGPAPPLVTGTFGGADFIHSLMGEATDHISQASVVDLSNKIKSAQESDSDSKIEALKAIMSHIPSSGGDSKVQEAEDIKAKAYDFNPDEYAPEEVQQQLMQILRWRDDTMRQLMKKIEMIPGLDELLENLTNALNEYVYTLLAPWLGPILQQATGVLNEGSKAVIDSDDQYEVFNNPNASDPSHSLLSKDHFGLILNEPAGKVAQVVVENTVNLIVAAWSDHGRDINGTVEEILEAFHHPYYNTGRSNIQNRMFERFGEWFNYLGDQQNTVVRALSKESVKQGKNKRQGQELRLPDVGEIVTEFSDEVKNQEGYNKGDNYGATTYSRQDERNYRESGGNEYEGGYPSAERSTREAFGADNEYRRSEYSTESTEYRRETYGFQQSQYREEDDGNRGYRPSYARNDYESSRNDEGFEGRGNEYESGRGEYDGTERYHGGSRHQEESEEYGHGEEHHGHHHKHHKHREEDYETREPESGEGDYERRDYGGYRDDSGVQGGYEYGGGESDNTYGMERLRVQGEYGEEESGY